MRDLIFQLPSVLDMGQTSASVKDMAQAAAGQKFQQMVEDGAPNLYLGPP